MSAPDTAPDLLDKAADIIVRNGFHQDEFFLRLTVDGLPLPHRWAAEERKDPRLCPVCAGGAINVAAGWRRPDLEQNPGGPRGYHLDALRAFARHVDPNFEPAVDDRPYAVIGEWNDETGRTLDQVTAALRECAAGLRKEEGAPA